MLYWQFSLYMLSIRILRKLLKVVCVCVCVCRSHGNPGRVLSVMEHPLDQGKVREMVGVA